VIKSDNITVMLIAIAEGIKVEFGIIKSSLSFAVSLKYIKLVIVALEKQNEKARLSNEEKNSITFSY